MTELVVSANGVQTQHVHLHKDRTTLGRRHHNDIALSDLSVSGVHCVFERQGLSEMWVKDLGSTNGTVVNGERVQHQRLKDQDVLFIGIYEVRYLGVPEPSELVHTAPMALEALGAPGTAGALRASLQVLSGPSAGLEVPVVKAVTTFGTPGITVVAVTHRRHGYFVALVEGGEQPAFLNGKSIGADPELLADQDILELTGSKMLFVLEQ